MKQKITNKKQIVSMLTLIFILQIVFIGISMLCDTLFTNKGVMAAEKDFTYTVFVGKATITRYNGSDTEVTIPEILGGYSVTTIGDYAFYNCESLTSITIPNSVTTIGELAFYNCESLTSITIPNSVRTIWDRAFMYCYSLTNITIPNSVTTIGEDAFYHCESLTSITIPNSVRTIESSAFSHCESLTSITIPNSVTTIESSAFESCYSLTSITIPNSVTTIWDRAFANCTSIESITIPSSVTTIGRMVFSLCTNLKIITVDSDNTIYSSVSGVLFNKSKTTIICYPAGKTDITYTIPNSVTTIGEDAFMDCESLTSITIPNSVTTIGGGAFANCTSIESITIPSSVTTIGRMVFSLCTNLKIITVDSDNTIYSSVSGVLFNKSKTTIICYPADKTDITYTIPNSVTTIGEEAFYNCESLTSITIPESVTTIEGWVFANCTSIESITIPNSVTDIGEEAFYHCESLTSITIPNSVTTIAFGAFSECYSLTSITIPNSVTTIGDFAFANCTSIESITIPNTVTSIACGAFYNCESLTSITIPNSVTTIESSAFESCHSLTSITIPNSVTTIGDAAFWECYSLTSITIPESVTTIGDRAFTGCTSLTSITIPESVTTIGDRAFTDCTSIESITIPNSVTDIGEDAFMNCNNLTIYGIEGSNIDTYSQENLINFASLTFTSLEIITPPTRTTYYSGETFDVAGMVIKRNYGYDTDKTVKYKIANNECAVTPPGALTYGANHVTIGYTENNVKKTVDQAIIVKDITNPSITNVAVNPTTWTNQDVTLTVTATDTESGIASYKFGNDDWSIKETNTYKANTDGIVIKVKDNSGNITTYSQTININQIDKTAPTIEISPDGGTVSQNESVKITVADEGGSGLASSSNEYEYEYQLSESSTVVPTGTWLKNTSGTTVNIGDGLTGDRYLWVKSVVDNAGNESEGTVTGYTVSSKFTFDNRNTNNNLATLTIDNGTLTEKFNKNTTTYTATVAYGVTSITIGATTEATTSSFVSNYGPRTVTLNGESNTIDIKVQAENEEIKTYTITVTREQDKEITSIAVTTPPTKTSYVAGQDFDNTGMVVTATYNDSKTEIITGYTVTNGTNLTSGQTSVTIQLNSNNEITTTQNITVAAKEVSSIAVTTPPTKTSYVVGQDFDNTGMVVTATYNDSKTEIITGYTVTNGTNLTSGQTSVTIQLNSNNEITTTQNITVVAKELHVTSSVYKIENGYIGNVSTNTTAQELLENLESNFQIKVYDKNNQEITNNTSAKLTTGAKIVTSEEEYKIVVTGDANGDGKADSRDSLAILYHRAYENSQYTLANEYFEAADINKNGKIDGQDALRLLYSRAKINGYEL